jgi:translation elongation factor EF-1alpha
VDLRAILVILASRKKSKDSQEKKHAIFLKYLSLKNIQFLVPEKPNILSLWDPVRFAEIFFYAKMCERKTLFIRCRDCRSIAVEPDTYLSKKSINIYDTNKYQ